MKREGKIVKVDIDVPTMYRVGDMSRNIRMENGDVIFVQAPPRSSTFTERCKRAALIAWSKP